MATKSNASASTTVPGIRLVPTTGRGTYRAIGRPIERTGLDIPLSELSDEQVAAVKRDPWLVVTDIQITPDDGTDDSSTDSDTTGQQ
ncbi:hypothetical protein AB3X91_03560 [Paraburkholderia sp. BR14263]|uniref:hypothetical protein n=1 Tax=unclassified Paraburkholderia TaxID=2615204 RepID=UPI0034CFE3A3